MTSVGDASRRSAPSATDSAREIWHRIAVLRERPQVSYFLVMGLTGALVIVGLVFVLSASSVRAFEVHGSTTWYLKRQAVFALVGLGTMVVASRTPLRLFRAMALPALIGTILLLMAVPVIGATRFAATRWIDFGPIQLQPSELAKIALIVWCADIFVRKERSLNQMSHLLVPVLPVLGLIAVLVMGEPDMGTTIVIVLVVLTLLWVVGTPMRIFGWLFGCVVAVTTIAAIAAPYRLARLTSAYHPFNDASDTGYQAVQGLYALSSGGWLGVGLGGSKEKWSGLLPNAHTDFIFAVVGEETGLLGTLLVLMLFGALAATGVRIARRTQDPYARLVAAGITAWLVGQAVINIATVVGALPITGIPLPFISYGGTSLVLTMFAAGILAACARTEPGAAGALAARPRLLSPRSRGQQRRPANVVELPTRRPARKNPRAAARKDRDAGVKRRSQRRPR